METYADFLARINSFEKMPIDFGTGHFDGSPSIAHKVYQDNTFKNFYGDTVVFGLSSTVKNKLAEIVNELYRVAPECFCERLVSHTFHVTLHDLSNSAALSDVAEELFFNELKIIESMSAIKKHKNAKIKMKSNNIFNMVGTSLVMGLYPTSEADYRIMMDLYTAVDGVKKLSYPLTPHITLAYYNINGFDARSAKSLINAVNKLNDNPIEIDINVADLFYQKFTSMNNYTNIVGLAK